MSLPVVLRVGIDPDANRSRRRHQGETLRKVRELRRLTISELADALGVTAGAVSQWENGRTTPRQHLQVAIARVLEVPHSTIFGLDREVA
jgi:transcriptional regulator with XRE-family HTH domain